MLALLKKELGLLLRSPVRIACLFLVIAMGLISNPQIPGETFRWAATIGGFLTCVWGAGTILDDRDSGRLEMLIVSGTRSGKYLCSKLLSLVAFAAIPGILLIILASIISGFLTGETMLLSYSSGFFGIYLPIALFGACFGMGLGTVTRSRVFPIVVFSILWMMNILWLPSITQIFDVTGESLFYAYFDIDPKSITPADYPDVPPAILQSGIDELTELHAYSQYNVLFLSFTTLLAGIGLWGWLYRRWENDASTIISDSSSKKIFDIPLPQKLTELKVMGFPKILALMFVALLGGLLVFAPTETNDLGIFLIGSFTPLCFALAYAGVYSIDTQAGVAEFHLSSSRYWVPYARRLIVITTLLLVTLCFQAVSFQEIISKDVISLVFAGLSSALLFGGLAFVLGIITGNESTAVMFVLVIWVLTTTTVIGDIPTQILNFTLHPFFETMGISISSTDLGFVFALLVGCILFATGHTLLGRSERLILK